MPQAKRNIVCFPCRVASRDINGKNRRCPNCREPMTYLRKGFNAIPKKSDVKAWEDYERNFIRLTAHRDVDALDWMAERASYIGAKK